MKKSEFVEKAKNIHGNKYDYESVEYVNNKIKVNIICKIHGIFKQTPSNHLSGHECLFCAGLNKKTNSYFIDELNKIHGNKYDYSKVNYIGNKSKIIIVCNRHGDFKQTAITHLRGSICPKCNNETRRKSNSDFISESNMIHGDVYDYSNSIYINARTKISILCKKHGAFIQNPRLHLMGKGCPTCKQPKGERLIREYLKSKSIDFIEQKKFDDVYIKKLRFDFYLPIQNICIEFNGRQHYEPVSIFGGENGYKVQQQRDNLKIDYCRNKNIQLITIKYDEDINLKLQSLISVII